jgi:hypothetical protein
MEPRRPCSSAQFVDLGEPGILARQIGQSAALKPFTVQPPFAARRQQAVRDQRLHGFLLRG